MMNYIHQDRKVDIEEETKGFTLAICESRLVLGNPQQN